MEATSVPEELLKQCELQNHSKLSKLLNFPRCVHSILFRSTGPSSVDLFDVSSDHLFIKKTVPLCPYPISTIESA